MSDRIISRDDFIDIIKHAARHAGAPDRHANALVKYAHTANFVRVGGFISVQCPDGTFAGCPLTEIGRVDLACDVGSWERIFFKTFDRAMLENEENWNTQPFLVQILDSPDDNE